MKKKNITLLVLAAVIVGIVAGHLASSFMWRRVLQDSLISSSLDDVATTSALMTCLRDDRKGSAARFLEHRHKGALESVEFLAQELNRPDLLSNSVVIEAKGLQEQKRNEGVPVEEWPEFIPLSKIEQYLGFQYSTPTLGEIYGDLRNVKVVAESATATLLIPGEPVVGFVGLERTRDRIGFSRPIVFRHELTSAECQWLKSLLLDYDSFGDQTLGHGEPDIAFRFEAGRRWVDVVLDFDLGEVDTYSNDQSSNCRCISPKVLQYAERLRAKYYSEKTPN